MAGQRQNISLDALSKHVTETVIEHLTRFVDGHKIAIAILFSNSKDVDMSDEGIETAAEAAGEAIRDYRDEEAIKDAITNSLKDAGLTNEPPAVEASNID
jgi:hypothetical protein